jgi:hypothetical protein
MAKKVRKKNLTIIGDPEFIEQIIEQRPGLLEHYDLEIEEPLPTWPPGVEKQPTKGETTRAIVAFARRKALLRLPFWQVPVPRLLVAPLLKFRFTQIPQKLRHERPWGSRASPHAHCRPAGKMSSRLLSQSPATGP